MSHQKKDYKEGESFTDDSGNQRKVVAVIGDLGQKPTIVVKDAKGEVHYLTPSVSLEAFSTLSNLLPLVTGEQKEAVIVETVRAVSSLCIANTPLFTPDFIMQNFDFETLLKMVEAVMNLAAELINANIKQYNEDPVVKNEQSGTSRSNHSKNRRKRTRNRNNTETGQG